MTAIDTWTVHCSVSHEDDKAEHRDRNQKRIRIANKNINTQMQTDILVPVNNDHQQQYYIFDILEQNKRADNTGDTLRNTDLLQDQDIIISIKDDCSDQSPTNEQIKHVNICNCEKIPKWMTLKQLFSTKLKAPIHLREQETFRRFS